MPKELDEIVLRALARDRDVRFADARSFAVALERFLAASGRSLARADVGEWLDALFPGSLAKKRQLVELTRRGDSAVPLEEGSESAPTAFFRPPEPTQVRDTLADTAPEGIPVREPKDEAGPAPGPATDAPSSRRGDETARVPARRPPVGSGPPAWLLAAAIAIIGGAALAYWAPWEEGSTGPAPLPPVPASSMGHEGGEEVGTVGMEPTTAMEGTSGTPTGRHRSARDA